MRLRAALALLAVLVAVGCKRIERPLVIDAKDFAEQQVIAEIVAQKLRASRVPAGVTTRTAALMNAGLPGSDLTLVEASGGGGGLRGQADQVRAGELDGLLIMAELGHPLVAALLEGGLELVPLDLWEVRGNRVTFPFLQPVTIPGATYAGQREPIDSVGSQVVLAAARPTPGDAVGIVGPGSAAIREILPIRSSTVARIRDALDVEVRLDPSLPVALAAPRPPPERPTTIATSPAGSVVTLAVIVVVVLIGRLYARPERHTDQGHDPARVARGADDQAQVPERIVSRRVGREARPSRIAGVDFSSRNGARRVCRCVACRR